MSLQRIKREFDASGPFDVAKTGAGRDRSDTVIDGVAEIDIDAYSTINKICRPRARTGDHKIVNGRIIGVGDAAPEPVIDTIREDGDGLVIQVRLNGHMHRVLRRVAEQQRRGMKSTLSRALAQTVFYMARKGAE